MTANKKALDVVATKPGLSAKERRLTCVHESAHAVIYALGGFGITQVAVAPEGAAAWTVELRKGEVLTDLWGVCEKFEDHPAEWFRTRNGGFDRKQFRACLKPFPGAYRRRVWRMIRAHLCAVVAGELAEHIYRGQTPEFDFDGDGDSLTAMADEGLLLGHDNLENMVELTIRKLQTPQVWKRIVELADALEMSGRIAEGIEAFLPVPEPSWPPACAKAVVE
jgi:hypothetical protein